MLIADETGFVKKGRRSAGVQRQYSGTAGRIENCQVAVFLSYASPLARALIDRRLYVPRSWTDDPDRCAAAGIPDDSRSRQPQLAWQMIAATLAAGVAVGFFTGDECYGRDPVLRASSAPQDGYVVAVARNQYVTLSAGLRERVDVTEVTCPQRVAALQLREGIQRTPVLRLGLHPHRRRRPRRPQPADPPQPRR